MKKIKHIRLLFIAVLLFTFNCTTKLMAQAPASHVFFVNTQYSVSGLDSVTRAERNVMLKEYHDKVTMKNDLILSVTTMAHFFSEDSREFVTVYEFAKFEDIVKAFDKDTELENKAWPDLKQRSDFLKKMNGYFVSHKDAIYNGMPTLKK